MCSLNIEGREILILETLTLTSNLTGEGRIVRFVYRIGIDRRDFAGRNII